MNPPQIRATWDREGYVSPLCVFSGETAATHRKIMEETEAVHGKLHYRYKMHTVLPSLWEIATNETLLDAVEAVIGPDIMLYNVCSSVYGRRKTDAR